MNDIQKIIDKANAGDVKPWVSPELGVVPLTVGENVQPLTVGPHLPYATGIDFKPGSPEHERMQEILSRCNSNSEDTCVICGTPVGREYLSLRRTCAACVVERRAAGWTPAAFAKHDHGKPRHSLIPPEAITEIARVFTYGATKYGDDNWRKCTEPMRLYDAAQRHLHAHLSGETHDEESGLLHLAHAATNLVMLLYFQTKETTHEEA